MDREDPDFDLAALELGQPPLEVAPRRPVTPAESRAPAPPAPDAAPREEGDAPSPAAEVGEAAGAPPPRTPPPPATPADLRGLSASEAAARAGRGLGNVDRSRQRSDREIIRGNLLTYFNIVLGSLIVALFVLAAVEQEVGKFQDALFVGIVVAANVSIGTFQEIRAARTLRQLAALAAPRATVVRDGQPEAVRSDEVVQGDLILLKPGDQVVADGPVIDGAAEIDESLLTGESESVRKTVGDSLLSGSFSAGGHCYYRAAQVGVDAYAMRLTADAQQLVRRATPLQVRFRRMLRLLLIATAVLGAMLLISEGVSEDNFGDAITFTAAAITSIVPDGLLLAMTVAFTVGAVRVGRAGAIVQDIAAVEALNYVDVICLDKTGTITANALTFRQAHWARGGAALQPWLGGFAAAMARENRTAQALAVAMEASSNGARAEERVPFTSARRWSAARLVQGGEQRTFVLGAPETVLPACDNGGELESDLRAATALGLRAVIFAEAPDLPDPDERLDALHAVALLTFADSLRPEITQAFTTMTELGIEPKVISGDNPETVVALLRQLRIRLPGGAIAGPALEALDAEGFARAAQEHSIFGRIAPQQKARIVAALREGGHFVAMVGDGANDVRALREADVAVAMESGAGTARAVSGIVLRNDSFHALVQGTAIAQRVLGRSAQLSKLYITKSFYAYMIIVASICSAWISPSSPAMAA